VERFGQHGHRGPDWLPHDFECFGAALMLIILGMSTCAVSIGRTRPKALAILLPPEPEARLRMNHKPTLRTQIASSRTKQQYVNQLFETIAPAYDFFTRFFSYGMDRRWKRRLLHTLRLEGDERALDLACGTGDITFAIAERLDSGCVYGLDITDGMLAIARRKLMARRARRIAFCRADVMHLPVCDDSMDCVACGYALRNVPDVEGLLREILRVLKPGGRLSTLDFGIPRFRPYRWLYMRYLFIAGSVVGYVLHRDPDTYRYIPESIRLYPGQLGVRASMDKIGFVETGFEEFGGGIMAINYGAKRA
jgi:demethylmenaquinone methyltransferase/2-methoxy-6-polyprenyl-1,4-benzoquinol methylase